MNIIISSKIETKLLDKKHNVRKHEVIECFANRDMDCKYITDEREGHKTDPETLWFIAQTDYGRELKIMFVQRTDKNGEPQIYLKSAFEANQKVKDIYKNA